MPGTRGAVLHAAGLPSTSLADVVVVGADAAGLVLAIDLVRHRTEVVLLDAESLPVATTGSATVALDVPSQELLEDLGVLDRLIAAIGSGCPISVMSELEPLVAPRSVLSAVLGERLIELGARVHRGYTYAGCEPDGARLDAYVSGPDGPITVRSRYLVRTDVPDSAVDDARRFAVGAAGGVNRGLQDAYDLGWKLAAVIGGAPAWIAQTYQIERIAGRACPLTLPCTGERPVGGVIPGDRAPDAPILSASGAATRLAALLQGPHWTLLGYGPPPAALADAGFAACAGLHVHVVGALGDLADIEGELQWAYGLSDGDWVLIRPDGLIAAVVHSEELARLDAYVAAVGLRGGG